MGFLHVTIFDNRSERKIIRFNRNSQKGSEFLDWKPRQGGEVCGEKETTQSGLSQKRKKS